jgi:hypothetical protein
MGGLSLVPQERGHPTVWEHVGLTAALACLAGAATLLSHMYAEQGDMPRAAAGWLFAGCLAAAGLSVTIGLIKPRR